MAVTQLRFTVFMKQDFLFTWEMHSNLPSDGRLKDLSNKVHQVEKSHT